MMRLFEKLTGGRVWVSRFFPSREARASALPPVSYPPSLEAAIDTAQFIMRESNDDDYRVAVLCAPLGGSFIYSHDEARRRIRKHYPELSDELVMRGLHHLESRFRLHLKPVQRADRARGTWVNDWGWKQER